MWRRGRVLIVAVAVLSLAACAARGRAVAPETRPGRIAAPDPISAIDARALEIYIEKVQAISKQAVARPARPMPISVERWDKSLASALVAATALPSPDHEKAVAREYVRLKVPDRAAHHLTRAVQMDPKDSEAREGLARIWRDAGLLHLALSEAHRAVYYGPRSASAQNTLGTVLLRLGMTSEAISRFEQAFRLERTASYALNNLCYARFLEADAVRAVTACQRALELSPGLSVTRNNLALAYAATGDFEAAARELSAAGDPAAAQYNLGVISLAHRRFVEAAAAFDTAVRLRPGFALAAQRATQARRLAAESPDPGDPR